MKRLLPTSAGCLQGVDKWGYATTLNSGIDLPQESPMQSDTKCKTGALITQIVPDSGGETCP